MKPIPRILFLVLLCPWAQALDLSRTRILQPENITRPERKAAVMLADEVEKRTGIRWEIGGARADGEHSIALGQADALRPIFPDAAWLKEEKAGARDGFRIRAESGTVFIIGNDSRGTLFGAGCLLRHMTMTRNQAALADGFNVTTAPKYPLRGHQLGYRPKTHSYDAWDVPTWEQYYRDLIVFGANAVELIPPRSDDDADSPHFPLPPMKMMTAMSSLANDYDLDVWIWYPAMDADYSNAATVEFALKEWASVFEKLPRIDAVFVPGGDPGHTRPKYLLGLLAKQAESLHRMHPKAEMWVSPQSFNAEWFDEFLEILRREEPTWLNGVVFGPQVRVSLPELRAAVPPKYPIRHYPDITHSRQCQYPVPDWDVAFAITEGRECINPRPVDQAAIFRLLQPYTIGFLTYSEGCNDDLNKAVWSALGWDPEIPVIEILRQYSRYFVGERYADSFAQGLLALERNWRGSLVANDQVYTTLAQFQRMEKGAEPHDLLNWRFQQALFRAYYDAYTRRRLICETAQEERAMGKLREAATRGSRSAIDDAEKILSAREIAASDWRARIFELGEALFQSIQMQLSVPRYKAIGVDRGASLDTIDYPLNNRRWLKERFDQIRPLAGEKERLAAIDEIIHWTDPGPGGFYDNPGNTSAQPHLVRGHPFERDPGSLVSSKTGFEEGDVPDEPDEKIEGALRMSWIDHAESLVDQQLRLRYDNLDPRASYKLRVVYGGDSPKRKIRLVANENIEIHPFIQKPFPFRPIEFDIPPEATRNGELVLSWNREQGLGGNGRGCQVSEIWLMRR